MTSSQGILDSARARLGSAPALAAARAELDTLADDLTQVMRVALVGRVSAGKSTLANALLGGYRAPTGVQELTVNVNWISYGPERSLELHFRDGRAPQRRDIGELERYTVRVRGNPEWSRRLATISHLRVTDPAPYLRSFDLIDTPGLDSVFEADSETTLGFLGGPVDAVVLVFSRALQAGEPDLVARLHEHALSPSPINAIAALTKVELLWRWPEVRDPRPVADRVAAQMMDVPAVRRAVHRVQPVASLVGAAAATLDATDLADLQTLAALPVDTLGRRVRRADAFARAGPDDLAIPAERRAALHARLSGYGLMLACGLIRDGITDLADLRTELDGRSGMAAFRRRLVEHFGGRAELIKLNHVYARMQSLPDRYGHALAVRDRVALHDATREFTRHGLARSPLFAELDLLCAYYEHDIDLRPEDACDLLRATGEHGLSIFQRLGVPQGTPRDELAAAARRGLRRWRERAMGGGPGGTRRAARVLVRTYERLVDEVEDVRRDGGGP